MALSLHLITAVTRAIHRLIERRSAEDGDAIAVAHDQRSLSYRELNAAANIVARRLLSSGFKHGMRARIQMGLSADLAVALLAILKAGGCYLWSNRPAVAPGLSIRVGGASPADERDLHLGAIPAGLHAGPNLPVVTRETDIACLLERAGGTPIAVPHATVLSMIALGVGARSPWAGEAGAFELWIALMSGKTAMVSYLTSMRDARIHVVSPPASIVPLTSTR